jgi:uncharacterized HhH-GPD family protein
VLHLSQDQDADKFLTGNWLALLIGMVLDQQVTIEKAFSSPAELSRRLGTPLDAAAIAAMPLDDLTALFRERPALHRYPGSMAKRTHALCVHLVDEYDGDAAKLWTGVDDPQVLFDRIRALPGYGEEKAKIFLAILGKRLEVAPKGWEACAVPFSDSEPRSVADIDSPENLQRVRAWKQAQKAKGKSKAQ